MGTQLPLPLRSPTPPWVPRSACPSQNQHLRHPLSWTICSPRQLRWAWVGASLCKGLCSLATLPSQWGCPVYWVCSGRNRPCLQSPPESVVSEACSYLWLFQLRSPTSPGMWKGTAAWERQELGSPPLDTVSVVGPRTLAGTDLWQLELSVWTSVAIKAGEKMGKDPKSPLWCYGGSISSNPGSATWEN